MNESTVLGRPAGRKLIDAPEAAAMLGVPIHTLYRCVRDGLIPVVRIGRRQKFSPQLLTEWMQRGGQALPGGWRREPEEAAPVEIASVQQGS